ncbi:hypothetical protein NQU49_27685, partial [Escherichia coli]|uniref:hypothetical protein n=1 Tax=Escherichia coli TaxID=562 RepID=UPI002118DE35
QQFQLHETRHFPLFSSTTAYSNSLGIPLDQIVNDGRRRFVEPFDQFRTIDGFTREDGLSELKQVRQVNDEFQTFSILLGRI